VAGLIAAFAANAQAAPPEVIRFQGTITSLLGGPAPDGQYVLHARIYEDAGGTQLVYDAGEMTVPVVGGAYALVLSPATAGDLAEAFADSPRFLEIEVVSVNGQMLQPAEILLPRQEIASVPYALNGSGSGVPTGTVVPFAGAVAPSGWQLCDGSEVDRTAFSDLFAVVGETYGPGDGTTTFNLPDLRGRVPFGLDPGDTDFDSLAESGGSKNHNHSMGTSTQTIGTNIEAGNYFAHRDHKHNLGNGGNVPPYVVLNWIIKE
jgi:hypothetical protein